MSLKYKRILLKLSGESLMGDKPFGISQERLNHYAIEIKSIMELGVELALEVWMPLSQVSRELRETTWVCWPLVSMVWHFRVYWRAMGCIPD